MIINPKFKEEWLTILKYNDGLNIRENARYNFDEKIRIPLTNLDIQAFVFYYLNELLYPEFVYAQQNIMDIIVSRDLSKVLKVIYYETSKAGIHENYEILSPKDVNFKQDDLEDLEQFYMNLHVDLEEKKSIKISSLRIFNEELFDIINEHYIDIENITQFELLLRLTRLFQEIYEKDLIHFYPEPNFHFFLKKSIKILKNIDLSELFNELLKLFPEFNISIIFGSDSYNVILKALKREKLKDDFDFKFDIISQDSLKIDDDLPFVMNLLPIIQTKLNTEEACYFNQEHVISLLSSIFELEVPFRKESILLVLQKIIFAFRNFKKKWYMYPRPPVYNAASRYIIRTFGLNFNLKKMSHWAIPSFLSTNINSFIGLKSKVLIIYTDISDIPKSELKEKIIQRKAFKTAFLLDLEDSTVASVTQVTDEEIFNTDETISLKTVRNDLSKKYGIIDLVLSLDQALIKKVLEDIIKFSEFTPFSAFKTLKMVRKDYYLDAYPEIPHFKLLKEKKSYSFLRLLLPIIIDKHEF